MFRTQKRVDHLMNRFYELEKKLRGMEKFLGVRWEHKYEEGYKKSEKLEVAQFGTFEWSPDSTLKDPQERRLVVRRKRGVGRPRLAISEEQRKRIKSSYMRKWYRRNKAKLSAVNQDGQQ